MKKTDTILKKAELFEKLSIYGNKHDFLKALAEDPITAHEYFIAAKNAALYALSQIPPDLRYTMDADNATHYAKNATTLDDINVAIQSLNKLVPWMKSSPNNNTVFNAYREAKEYWTLPEDSTLLEKGYNIPSEAGPTEYVMPVDNIQNIKRPISGSPEMNKYFMIIQNGKKLLNSIDLMDPQIDYKKLMQYRPGFDQLAVDLTTFKQDFYKEISRPGEAQTLAARADSLLSEHDRLAPKMQEASKMAMSKGIYA